MTAIEFRTFGQPWTYASLEPQDAFICSGDLVRGPGTPDSLKVDFRATVTAPDGHTHVGVRALLVYAAPYAFPEEQGHRVLLWGLRKGDVPGGSTIVDY